MLVPLLNVPGEPHDIDSYFVVFHSYASADDKTRIRHLARRGRLQMGDEGLGVGTHVHYALNEQVYTHALNGFSMRLDKQGLYELMVHADIISYIERDIPVQAFNMPLNAHHGLAIQQASQTPTQIPFANRPVHVSSSGSTPVTDNIPFREFGSASTGFTEVINGTDEYPEAGWNLDRLDKIKWNVDPGAESVHGDKSYTYRATGYGVDVYVIDTGINYFNLDFEGRATPFYDGKVEAFSGVGYAEDCHGHGSHVAGIIGGKKWGVAKGVNLKGVKVLDCMGSGVAADVVNGIEYVIAHRSTRPSIINLSLGCNLKDKTLQIEECGSKVMDAAVARAVAANITVVTAAGNDNADACYVSPASSDVSITVGATDSLDNKWENSNIGSCLDIFAPGVHVVSNTIGVNVPGNTSITSMDGTSQAAPHVAGVAALYLEANPTSLPAQVKDVLIRVATANILNSMDPYSPNRLLSSKVIDDSWVASSPMPTYQATNTPSPTRTRKQTRTRKKTRTNKPSRTRKQTQTHKQTRTRKQVFSRQVTQSRNPSRTRTPKAGSPTLTRQTGTVSSS